VSSALTLDQCIVLNECGIWDIKIEAASTLDLSCCDRDPSRLRNLASTLNDLGGNFFADPLFCDAIACPTVSAAGDYTVAADSPCLPANNGCGLPIGALGEGCSGTPIESMTWGGIKARFR
jgi:hypothetical protein